MDSRTPVLFISFGGPEKPEDVMPFLEIVTRGRGIPRERLLGVAEHYDHIGGRSPINEITRRQGDALSAAFASAGDPRHVYLGQRNWHPFIEDTLRRMQTDGVPEAIGFCTAAYRSEASLERYVDAVETARTAIGPGAPVVRFVGPWFDHPLFIAAVAARIREHGVPVAAPWVFTAHSIPCAMARESTYVEELRTACSLVAAELGKTDWSLAYTSRSGNPRDPWLEPDVSRVIARHAAAGATDLVAIPLGFVADHVEVLFDLDVEAKEAADKVGLRLHRVPTVGDHPLFVAMMADVIRAGTPTDTALSVNSQVTCYRDGGRGTKIGRDASSCFCFPGEPNPPCRQPSAPAGARPAR